jgi:hypothetical protein
VSGQIPATRSLATSSCRGSWARRAYRSRRLRQEKELGVFFDTVMVCTVTGPTHAGMIAGTALEGRARPPSDRNRCLQRTPSSSQPFVLNSRLLSVDSQNQITGMDRPSFDCTPGG